MKPYRKNCEGYFFYEGKVLAQDVGYILFPGGGVDEGEDSKDAIIRETFEETGAILENVKKIGELKFLWGPNWAKTEKQKKRYEEFKGEDMHFFVGKIKEFKEHNHEDYWEGNKLMSISEVIKLIKEIPYDDDVKEYREFQLTVLQDFI